MVFRRLYQDLNWADQTRPLTGSNAPVTPEAASCENSHVSQFLWLSPIAEIGFRPCWRVG